MPSWFCADFCKREWWLNRHKQFYFWERNRWFFWQRRRSLWAGWAACGGSRQKSSSSELKAASEWQQCTGKADLREAHRSEMFPYCKTINHNKETVFRKKSLLLSLLFCFSSSSTLGSHTSAVLLVAVWISVKNVPSIFFPLSISFVLRFTLIQFCVNYWAVP